MRILRVFAQLIDLFIGFAAFVASYLTVPTALSPFGAGSYVTAAAILAAALLLIAGLQYPFLKTGQTVGKAFFGLKIISDDPNRPLTSSILLQREIFLKLATCYFICIPVLFGQPGGHEAATKTKVTRQPRKRGENH